MRKEESLRINRRKACHIRIMPIRDGIAPEFEGEAEAQRWCEGVYGALMEPGRFERLHVRRSVRGGWKISAWAGEGSSYLAMCVRNEYGTENVDIYVGGESDRSDMVACAKFLSDNVESFAEDRKAAYKAFAALVDGKGEPAKGAA